MNMEMMARRKKAKKRFFTRGYHHCCAAESEQPLVMATGAFEVGLPMNETGAGDGRFGAVLPTVVDNETNDTGEGE